MSTFAIFLILIVIVAFLLIVVIMVQNPKGGGLSSSFGGGGTQQMGGVKKTTDFLDKSTWTLATILLVLILTSSLGIDRNGQTAESKILESDNIQLPTPTATRTTDDATKVVDPAAE
ncbi:preprotein translocase subunit SecG [Olleya sp. HaHaR_3_96]|uniref:preprotein translocase subunit SecG n=1 Tax=Olleya sp. HaHaR_3_96 TaxID=2745560 RepID=UPI001C4FC474|nr:preprotein translocase subunit SecG [Olleya sp. HaHaR_3_96]QXP61280.1 preprotein translocase subunit SecG [Olleya sp. HaHaR_3_96]